VALNALLKMPWNTLGSIAAGSGGGVGGGGVGIDLERHVLPPEGVELHSWCQGETETRHSPHNRNLSASPEPITFLSPPSHTAPQTL
jgi:hypothetical protein